MKATRYDAKFTVFDVRCASPSDLRLACDLVSDLGSRSDAAVVDEVGLPINSAAPHRVDRHRIRDYFDSISLEPLAPPLNSKGVLVFHRSVSAGRFWKDVMVKVVKLVEATGSGTAVEFKWRGDEDPLTRLRSAPDKP